MLATILGFALLVTLLLGFALLALALLLLGVALGLSGLAALLAAAPGGGPVLDLATAVQLAAGAAFVLGLLLVLVGLVSLLFPGVRRFLSGFAALLRLAGDGLALLGSIVPVLRAGADAMEAGGQVLGGVVADNLEAAGDDLVTVGQSVPALPGLTPMLEPLWIEKDDQGERVAGYLPNLAGLPDVSFVVGLQPAMLTPVTDGLEAAGGWVRGVGEEAATAGDNLVGVADSVRQVADLLEAAAPS